MKNLTPEIETWVKSSLGSNTRLLSCTRLSGSTSATLFRLTLFNGSGLFHCVLRLFTNKEWLAVEPDIPEHEAAALEKVHAAGMPVPQLLACDPRGQFCGLPALLMSEVPGKVDLIPMNIESWLEQQAEFLVRLHQVEPGDFPWKYRPYFAPAQLKVPEWSSHKGLWEEAIEIVRSPAPEAPIRFIHRDYHPVNVLWQRGKLTGVVDWVNACLGPAGVDVAWSRHNLAGAYGVPMADRFLIICREAMGTGWEYSPYWDLQTLMELLPGPFEVYPPWREFGLGHVTVELFTHRVEDYLASLLNGF